MKTKLMIFIAILILLFTHQESLTYVQWENLNIPIRSQIADIKIDKEGNILAGSLLSKHTLCISKNEGDTWSLLLDPNFPYEVDVAQILITDSLVFIGSFRDVVGLVATNYDELVNDLKVNLEFKNNGMTEYDEDGKITSLQVCRTIEKIGDYIYCGTNWDGIFRSSDNGESWEHKADGLPDACLVYGLASVDTMLFLSCISDFGQDTINSGLYYSTNNGDFWEKVNVSTRVIGTGGLISRDSILISCSVIGIYLSFDKGLTWIKKDNGLPEQLFFTLAANERYLFAGTIEGFVFMSTNMGDSWHQVNSEPFPGRAATIAISDNYLFVGTNYSLPGYNGRIYRAKLSDIEVSVAESNITAFSIYPNPAGDFINIAIDSDEGLLASEIQILDLLGLVVSKSELTDGNNRIDISNLARGTYFIKVGDKVDKFVKL